MKSAKECEMNILLSSVEQKTYMIQYFKEALGNNGKVFAADCEMTCALSQADGYIITPQPFDDSYIDSLTDYCKVNNISVIIPLSDTDLSILAKHKKQLYDNQISAVVSDESVIETCNDKWRTSRFLASIGLNQPKTYIDLDEARQDIESGNLKFPLILKPRWGTDYERVIQVDSLEELNLFHYKIRKDIFKSNFKYASLENENECIIIQEKIKGAEYSLDILNDLNGNYITSVTKKKLVVLTGETSIAQIEDNDLFEDIGKNISKYLKHIACLDVDCFLTESNNIVVLEINGRFGRQYPFTHLAGANFPKQIIEWLTGASTSKDYISPEFGVKGCKEWPLPVAVNF